MEKEEPEIGLSTHQMQEILQKTYEAGMKHEQNILLSRFELEQIMEGCYEAGKAHYTTKPLKQIADELWNIFLARKNGSKTTDTIRMVVAPEGDAKQG
jgi:hypothetical protein